MGSATAPQGTYGWYCGAAKETLYRKLRTLADDTPGVACQLARLALAEGMAPCVAPTNAPPKAALGGAVAFARC